MNDTYAALDAWIDQHFDEEVRFVQALVRVPTDTPPGNNAPHADRAAELLQAMGYTAEKHPVPAADVQAYVPGYRLKQKVQFDRIEGLNIPGVGKNLSGLKTSVFLEVEGAAHYLPAYAGNLDIMTSAALRTAEHMAQRILAAARTTAAA